MDIAADYDEWVEKKEKNPKVQIPASFQELKDEEPAGTELVEQYASYFRLLQRSRNFNGVIPWEVILQHGQTLGLTGTALDFHISALTSIDDLERSLREESDPGPDGVKVLGPAQTEATNDNGTI